MHIHLDPENEQFVLENMNDLQCSGSDWVNSLIAAVRESGYTREYKLDLIKKGATEKRVCKTFSMRRRSRSPDGYHPGKF